MKAFRWPPDKNEKLRAARSVTFEHMVVTIENGGLLDLVEHRNKMRYPRQQVFVVLHEGYVYLVPFVEEEDHYFLKTIIPSRKAKRDYLKDKDAEL